MVKIRLTNRIASSYKPHSFVLQTVRSLRGLQQTVQKAVIARCLRFQPTMFASITGGKGRRATRVLGRTEHEWQLAASSASANLTARWLVRSLWTSPTDVSSQLPVHGAGVLKEALRSCAFRAGHWNTNGNDSRRR